MAEKIVLAGKIVEMPIEEIEPYENNPRLNEGSVDYVANSIEEFGFDQPIVVDANMVIIAGHMEGGQTAQAEEGPRHHRGPSDTRTG